jgi:predicted ATP-grasp superfamily ATP-dependent carboligase
MAVVVVTDAEERSALATVRSLGRAGHEVHVAFSNPSASLAGRSRFARSGVRVAAPREAAGAAFAHDVADFAAHVGAELVLPVTDASVGAVLRHGSRFADVRLPLPSLASFELLSQKDRCLALAERLGMSTPDTLVLADRSEAARAQELGGFPAVIKLARGSASNDSRSAHRGVTYARNRTELTGKLAAVPASSYPVLIQRRIEGPGMGLFFLVWDGELLARFAHRRIREKPPSGGVSVVRESVAFDEKLGAWSLRLLEAAQWRGVAMVEFKLEQATGRPFLMEVNGRLWGSLQLAIDAGVDFPRLLVEACLGEDPCPVLAYRQGRKCRWLLGDTDHLLIRFARSAHELDLPPGHPGRLRVLASYLADFRPGVRSEVWRWDDPLPFFRETALWG